MVTGKLAVQSESYLRWIVTNFKAKDWTWVDSAQAILHNSSSPNTTDDESICLQDNAEPSTAIYGSLLKRCAEDRDLQAGKRIHSHVVHNGYARDAYVGNLLIQMYGKCRRVDLARSVFNAMLSRDLFSWNIMISAYAHNGQPKEALKVFKQMTNESVEPDVFVFATVLGVYAKCGRLDDARNVFDGMTVRDSGSWTAMISAYAQNGDAGFALELFRRMDHQGFKANRLTYVSVLAACGSCGDLTQGRTVYSRFLLDGHKPDLVMESALLNLYSKCGSLEAAEDLFKGMREKDVAVWTCMIDAYGRHGLGVEAVVLYRKMVAEGLMADSITYVALLGACSVAGACDVGKAVHQLLIDTGLEKNVKVQTALLCMYGKCGSVEDAKQVFDAMVSSTRDLIAWNAMLRAYARFERFAEAFELYESMEATTTTTTGTIVPDVITYGTLLTSCCSFQALDHGKQIHACLNAAAGVSLTLQMEMHTLLVNMYAKCGSIEESRRVFDRMPEWSLTVCNAVIVWYARYGIPREAFDVYSAMVDRGELMADTVTCIGALAACSSLGYLTQGRAIHSHMIAARLPPDIVLWTSLVNMYAKCGEVDEARSVFERMELRNVVTFNTMIAAYAQHGHIDEAEELYRRMVCEEGLDADCITLLCLLIACNHAGLHRHSRDVFVTLRGDHGIPPILDHYHCLVDLLSRVGRLQEAEEVLSLMPFQPGAVGWKSLLNGCAVHGDPGRGARAAVNACKLDPGDSSQYVLLSNVYAWFGKHNRDVSEVLKLMEKALDRCNQGSCQISYL